MALVAGDRENDEIQPFEDELVEIQGLDEEVLIEEGPPKLIGSKVQGNGRRGRAQWDESRHLYLVHTFDGLCLAVPENNLKEHEPVEPEDGGFDLAWPIGPGSFNFFGHRVAKMLKRKGSCVVQMFQSDEMRRSMVEAAEERIDYTLPFQEFVEAYLGRGAQSQVSYVKGAAAAESREIQWQDPLGHYCQLLKNMLLILKPALENKLGIRAWSECYGTVLRKPLAPRDESEEALQKELSIPLQSEDIAAGKVEQHLEFIQGRRLCAMYVVESGGGTLELYPREDLGLDTIRLPITRDKLIVFRHDLMNYSYEAASSSDLVLQCWFMEEPAELQLFGFDSDQRRVERIFGGPKTAPDRQVHIMAATCNFPGNGKYLEGAFAFTGGQVDGFLKIPVMRWDMDVYYDANRGDAATPGKSATQHSGFIREEEWMLFDNAFFGFEPEVAKHCAPADRLLYHTVFDLLYFAGYPDMKSISGREMDCVVACTGTDVDYMVGYDPNDMEGQEHWLQGSLGQRGFDMGTRVAYVFGLKGYSSLVDTACSASLVAANVVHAGMRRADVRGVDEAIMCTTQCLLTPWPYIGMSMAGMVGPSGRCLTFDVGASGFSRGEGTGGIHYKVSTDVQVTANRLAVYCGSFINQDGRSASLTAPNGPSQVLCMRAGLRDSGLLPENIVSMETHGTGTALGDPIEVGSCRTCFRSRDTNIPVTTAKSHTGHLEGSAGCVNIVKVIVGLTHACTQPNVHLKSLNPHIEDAGFPGCFPTERFCQNASYNTAATNAFGFGGTNSHADFFSRCRYGAFKHVGRSVEVKELDWAAVSCGKCGGPMCWRCGVAVPDDVTPGEKHRCSAIRVEFARYDYCSNCYRRGYQYGGDTVPENGRQKRELEDMTMYGPRALDAEWYLADSQGEDTSGDTASR